MRVHDGKCICDCIGTEEQKLQKDLGLKDSEEHKMSDVATGKFV